MKVFINDTTNNGTTDQICSGHQTAELPSPRHPTLKAHAALRPYTGNSVAQASQWHRQVRLRPGWYASRWNHPNRDQETSFLNLLKSTFKSTRPPLYCHSLDHVCPEWLLEIRI